MAFTLSLFYMTTRSCHFLKAHNYNALTQPYQPTVHTHSRVAAAHICCQIKTPHGLVLVHICLILLSSGTQIYLAFPEIHVYLSLTSTFICSWGQTKYISTKDSCLLGSDAVSTASCPHFGGADTSKKSWDSLLLQSQISHYNVIFLFWVTE